MSVLLLGNYLTVEMMAEQVRESICTDRDSAGGSAHSIFPLFSVWSNVLHLSTIP